MAQRLAWGNAAVTWVDGASSEGPQPVFRKKSAFRGERLATLKTMSFVASESVARRRGANGRVSRRRWIGTALVALGVVPVLMSSPARAQRVGAPVETGPQRSSPGGPADWPSVARGPGGWLAAWATQDGARRALLRTDGSFADPAPLTTGGYAILRDTGLAGGDDSWLAIWESNVGGTPNGYELWSGDGALMAAGTHTLEGSFHVASDGTQFLVVAVTPSRQEVAHLDATGVLTDVERIMDAGGGGNNVFDVVWDGSRFIVVYPNESGEVTVRDYDASGTPGGTTSFGGPAQVVRAATRGSGESLVVWSGPPGLVGAAVVSDGAAPAQKSLDLLGERQADYWDVGWDGNAYLVAHQDPTRALVGTRLDVDGTVLDATPFSLAPPTLEPFRVDVGDGTDGTAVVVFEPVSSSGAACPELPAIRAVRVQNGAAVDMPPLVASMAGNAQADPILYRAGTDVLLVHTDFADPMSSVSALFVGLGTPLSPGASVDVFTGRDPAWTRDAAGRSDGTGLVAAVDCSGGITARRIDAAGLIDPAIVLPATSGMATKVQVATDDDAYLVVWEESGAAELQAARISSSGVIQDPTPLAIPIANTARDLEVVFHQGQYVVLAGDSDGRELIPVDPAGTVGTATPAGRDPVLVASNGSETVLLDSQLSGSATDVAFLDATGSIPAGPRPTLDDVPFSNIAAVGPLGSGFLIVFSTVAGEADALAAVHLLPNGSVSPQFFLRIGPTPHVSDSSQRHSFVGTDSVGVLAYNWPVFTDDARVMRTLLQRVELLCDGRADGESCDDGVECTESDACQGGVCVGTYIDGCGLPPPPPPPPDGGVPSPDGGVNPGSDAGAPVAGGGGGDDGGCGCRSSRSGRGASGPIALALLLGGALRRGRSGRKQRRISD